MKLNKGLVVLLSTNSLILLAGAMLAPIYALFVEEIGGDLLDASYAAAAFALAAGITTMISGKFSDKIRETEYIMIAGYAIMALGFYLLSIVDTIALLLISQVIIGLGESVYSPSFDALYSRHLDKGKAGSEWGLWESMNYFTAATGAIIGGVIAFNFGFDILFLLMSGLCVMSVIYLVCIPRKIL